MATSSSDMSSLAAGSASSVAMGDILFSPLLASSSSSRSFYLSVRKSESAASGPDSSRRLIFESLAASGDHSRGALEARTERRGTPFLVFGPFVEINCQFL